MWLLRSLPINRALKPGGWIDCAEPGLWFDSFYVDLGPDDPYKQWSNGLFESGNQVGMSFDVGPYIKEWLEAAGFINVQEKKICSTVGKWSKDPWEREVGSWNQLRLVRGVEDFCSRRFVNQLHVSSFSMIHALSLLLDGEVRKWEALHWPPFLVVNWRSRDLMCTPPAGSEEQYLEGTSMVVSLHCKYKTDIFDMQQFFRGWTKANGIKRRGLERPLGVYLHWSQARFSYLEKYFSTKIRAV